ncbi:MAG: 16S rRNA (guanine(527)-N(7))-methyltransferase RsmG [candidate division WOR-3 bacterium]|nr:16S rRNA (guanine(527)-N(7))-methyltransferase RsmG [candidate division WOR-3 bacterium]MDW8113788.1 16S rRNA (guanine(527)-N(7))-methyltransferase RsmG [candidate division WOR-3 bacterium]
MADITWSTFDKILNSFGISLDEEKLDKLVRYHKLLLSERQRLNLYSLRDMERLIKYHFVDSVVVIKLISENKVVADLGSGAGFPGVIIKIFRPDLKVYLIESKHKKAVFLEKVILDLDLKECYVINKRIEELRNIKFDIVVSRLVAPLKKTLKWIMNMDAFKPDMLILYKKTRVIERELKEAEDFIRRVGYQKKDIVKFRYEHIRLVRSLLILERIKNGTTSNLLDN